MSTITPRTATVVIYQGDDLAKLERLDEAVDAAAERLRAAEKDRLPRLLHEADAAVAARAAHTAAVAERDAFAAQAEERGVAVVLNALPRKTWRALVREHPAREGVDEDSPLGVDMDTLPDVLLPKSIDPDASTITGDLGEFLESLSDYDYYDRLFLTAYGLNRGRVMADPTQRLGSAPSQTSAATSN